MRTFLFLSPLAILLLSACGETVEIQDDYVSARNHCQGYAEKRVAVMERAEEERYDPKQRNSKLVDTFNRCMGTKDWDMGKPKDAPVVAGGVENAKQGTLANRGVGIGVGPAYALEEKPVRSTGTASSRAVAAGLVEPSTLREPQGNRGLATREIEPPHGQIPPVQAEVPKPVVNDVRPDVTARTKAPAAEPVSPVSQGASGRLSSTTEDEIRKAVEQ